jgi:apolipoprotein N-acyltransferase
MGISAVIDSNGRVLQPQALPPPDPRVPSTVHVWTVPLERGGTAELPLSGWHDYKKVGGILLANIPLDDRVSLYARWGDWLPWSCWIVAAGALVWALVRRKARMPVATP